MIGALQRISMVAILTLVLLFAILVSYQLQHFQMDVPERIGSSFLSFWQYNANTVMVLLPLLIAFNTLYIIVLSNRSGINATSSLISGMLFLLSMLLCSGDAIFLWEVVCQTFIIMMCGILLKASSSKLSYSMIFYLGALVGLLSMHLLSFYLLLIFVCVIIFNLSMLNLRAFIYLIFGFGIIYLYFFSFLYLRNILDAWLASSQIDISLDLSQISWNSALIFGVYFIFILMLGNSFGKYSRKYSLADQKKRILLLILSIGLFVAIFFSFHYRDSYWLFLSPTMALLMSSFYSRSAQGRASWIFIIIFVILSLSSIFIPL